MEWHPGSWRSFKISQQSEYPDLAKLEVIEQKLSLLPPLVLPQEILELKGLLSNVTKFDKYFVIHAGDCAEEFIRYSLASTRKYLSILTQMAEVLESNTEKKIILIGRFAGQFAKPRSNPTERRDNIVLPSYRGDMINEIDFNAVARVAKPINLLKAYYHAQTKIKYLNIIYGSNRINKIYTSHEALLLNYEQAMTRKIDDGYYNLSAHFLWIGNRTRNLNEAHVEYARGIANPIAIKIGPEITADGLLELICKVNPQNELGKLILIARIGCRLIAKLLPGLMQATTREGCKVIWICDPMHGNTIKLGNKKIRRYSDMLSEIKQFFEISQGEGIAPNGIHIEMTEQEVQECDTLHPEQTQRCDPRLNSKQSLDLIHFLCQQIKIKNARNVS
jgi:3-deoxy-7-phosphoheptulonate synthase